MQRGFGSPHELLDHSHMRGCAARSDNIKLFHERNPCWGISRRERLRTPVAHCDSGRPSQLSRGRPRSRVHPTTTHAPLERETGTELRAAGVRAQRRRGRRGGRDGRGKSARRARRGGGGGGFRAVALYRARRAPAFVLRSASVWQEGASSRPFCSSRRWLRAFYQGAWSRPHPLPRPRPPPHQGRSCQAWGRALLSPLAMTTRSLWGPRRDLHPRTRNGSCHGARTPRRDHPRAG